MPVETPQEFGEELRRERELREVTREQLADVTKVSVRQIEALESGALRASPCAGLRARLRPRARAGTSGSTRSGPRPPSTTSTRRGRPSASGRPPARRLLLGPHPPLPAAKERLAEHDRPRRRRGARPRPPDRRRGRPERKRRRRSRAARGARGDARPATPTPAPAVIARCRRAGRRRDGRARRVDAARPARALAPPAPAGRTLTLTFSDDCWTEVSVDGRVVAAELFRKGTKRAVSRGAHVRPDARERRGRRGRRRRRRHRRRRQLGQVVRNFVIGEAADGSPQGG